VSPLRRRREPRIRERRRFSVADLVPSPDELQSRPDVRLLIVGGVAVALFVVMVLRLFTLQVVDAKTYKAAVNQNRIRQVVVPAPRGEILARSNTVLIGNQVDEQIVLSRQEALQHPSVIAQVAALCGETPAQVQAILNSPKYDPFQPAPVLDHAPDATIQYLLEHQNDYPGVSVSTTTQRYYPQGGSTAAHVLGYVGAISAEELKANAKNGYTISSSFGKTGLEQFYEAQLKGKDGTQDLAVNAQDKVVGVVSQTPAVPGDDLVLNLDLGLQTYTEQVLASQIARDRQTVDARSGKVPPAINGAAVVLDPHTGAVLAMASYPTYDLSNFTTGISQAQLDQISQGGALNNYAISGLYVPGSTFKLVTATASLQRGLMGADQWVNDTGAFTVPTCQVGGAGCVFNDDEAKGLGEINLAGAITGSSDYYFYNLGYLFSVQSSKYGATPIQDTARDYGLGQPTGVDLSGEAIGRVDSQAERLKLHAASPTAFPNTNWYVGDNIEMAFGQGATAVTPLQMANAYATFLNGGTRYAPQIANAVVTPEGRVVVRYQPRVEGHVQLNSAITGPILDGLMGVVNDPNGTAYGSFKQWAHLPAGYEVGGKTGSASNQAGLEPNSWFIGFGPGRNPDYVVAVVIDQGGYGADAAAPAVAQIFDYLATNPVGPIVYPSASHPPSPTPPPSNPPAGG
jgi:penicillin-binding protein 2